MNLQNISGVTGLFPGGLVIRDTGPGTPEAIIRSGQSINGSLPVGAFAVTHDEQMYLELDFSANPVDYLAFLDIDQDGVSGIATFVGGGTASFNLESTAGSDNSAEFFGIFRNDMPLITLVQLDASGDTRWGIDNIEYGTTEAAAVPEPASATLALLGRLFVGGAGLRRTRRVRRNTLSRAI